MPRVTGVYGRGAYEFRENSIVATIPFAEEGTLLRAETPLVEDENTQETGATPLVTPLVIPPVAPLVANWADEALEVVAEKILALCVEPKGIREIAAALGLKDKKSMRRYLRPLLDQGRLAMTIPNAPTSRLQKYIAVR